MTFDRAFAALIRLTGWGLGVYVIVTGKLTATESLGLILAFVGFDVVSKAREKKLPELIDRKRNGNGS